MSGKKADYSAVPMLWAQGLTLHEIADRIGRSYSSVCDFARNNRELCPKRCNVHADRRQSVGGASTIPKRCIMVPVVPNTGITLSPVIYTPVSVAAFSWDEVAA
jgi:hypothetical protein